MMTKTRSHRATGAPRAASNFGKSIQECIHRETGLVVNVHLFRHLAGKLFLDKYPGEYETVRRFLGHKKIDTTVEFYARLSSKKAVERYDNVVLSYWGQGQ